MNVCVRISVINNKSCVKVGMCVACLFFLSRPCARIVLHITANLQYSKLPFICCWRASAPLSTSGNCCLRCRPLEEVLRMADCGCHSLLGTRGRWTRCVARCGFRRRRPPWSCGKRGYRSSCSWCSCAANCAKPGTRRCRVIRWPLWQG